MIEWLVVCSGIGKAYSDITSERPVDKCSILLIFIAYSDPKSLTSKSLARDVSSDA